MSKINYYTPEGLQSLKDELQELITVQRPAISAQIGEAIDKGDLSENAEYDAAKEAQGMLEAKIAKMENLLANARVISQRVLVLFDTSPCTHVLHTLANTNTTPIQT